MIGIIAFTAAALAVATPTPHTHSMARSAALDTAAIERLTGAKGRLDRREGVFKVSVPRTDLAVKVGDVRLTPPSGLTSWAAFEPAGEGVMVMGDLVLTEEQVNPVMSAALDNGLEVTALHNHFLGESPRVMFMHIGGMGPLERMAGAVGKVLGQIKEVGEPIQYGEIDPAKSKLDGAALSRILGHPGDLSGGVYKVTVGREAHMHGHAIGTTMGVNTWAAFSGTDDRALVDGDFAMHESELQAVLKALRHAGIQIVSIHQHMTGEAPRILFLHYWGVGRADDLARGVRAALDRTTAK